MAKRGRNKNRTGNSKRPPAPSLGSAAAAKLPSVKPAAPEAEAKTKLELVSDAPSKAPSSAAPSAKTVETTKIPPLDPTPSPVSLDLTEDAKAGASERPAKAAVSDAPEAAEIEAPPSSRADAVEQVDEFEEAFFSSLPPEHLAAAEADDDDDDPRDARMRRLSEPAVVARRDRMRKRVAWGLAACAGVFFLAVGRAVLHSDPEPPRVSTVQAPAPTPAKVEAAPVKVETPPVAVAPVVSAEAAASAAPVEPAASAAPVVSAAEPAASAAPAAVAPVESAPAAVASAAPSGDAKTLRTQAKRLLESGKSKDAIEPALESTKLDPEHAEGWLLLGAAYQERGRHAEARQAFTSCVQQAKRGPRGECAAMVR